MPRLSALFLALSLAAASPAIAGSPPPESLPADTLSPAVQQALQQLSAEDYQQRQNALHKLELALGQQMRALVCSDDPEVQSRIVSLLQFHDGLTRWLLETLKLPNDQQKALLNFGLRPDVLPLLANLFSPDLERRVQGVRDLGKFDDPEATAILAGLLDDPDRAVYVTAMDVLWDRKPTHAAIDSLYFRAVEFGLPGISKSSPATPQPKITFRGKTITGGSSGVLSPNRGQDSTLACDLLIHLNAPQVNDKLKAFTDAYEINPNHFAYSSNLDFMKNAFRLIEAYKPKPVIAALYNIATAPTAQRFPIQINNEKLFYSNRTTALAALVSATGQKLEDYHLKRSPFIAGAWVVPSEADEDAAVQKIQDWWKLNAEKYDAHPPQPPAPSPE